MNVVARERSYSRSNLPLYGLSWLHFLNDGAANFLPGILPALLVSLGQSVFMASTLMTALLIGQAVQPAMGMIADRLGGKSLIIVGVLGTNLGMALIGWVNSVFLLFPILLLMGLANSLFHPQALTSARSLAKQRHGAVLSIFLVGGELGRGIWPLVASFVIVERGRQNLWILSLITLVSIPLLLPALPSLPPRHRDSSRVAWGKHWRPAVMLVAFVAARSLILLALLTYLPIQWHQGGGGLTGGAALISTILVVGVIGNIGGGWFSDRVGRRKSLLGSSALILITLCLLLINKGWITWPLLGVLGIALFSTLPVTVVIGQDIFPENRALGSGIALGLGNACAAMGLLLYGIVVAHLGIDHAFWMLCGLAVICFFLAFHLPYPKVVL